jgi:hypothetical protein
MTDGAAYSAVETSKGETAVKETKAVPQAQWRFERRARAD